MERFLKLSPASDPSLWETRRLLSELGFQEDHLQDLGMRLSEAAIAAAGVKKPEVGGSSIVAAAGSFQCAIFIIVPHVWKVAAKKPRKALLSHMVSPSLKESNFTAASAIEQSPVSKASLRVVPSRPPYDGVTHLLSR